MMNIKPTGFVIRFIISLFLLVCVGIDNAVAQSFPVEGKIYTIKARFTNGSGDLYLTNSSSTLTFPKTIEDGSYWKAVSTGNSSYPWSFQSIADPTKYLNGDMSSGISTTRMNFAVNVCNNVAGTYHLWAFLGGGTGDRNVSTWASNSGKSGFGKSGSGGCFGSGHYNNNWSTDYVITEYTPTPMGDNVSLSFVDASDNTIVGASVNYRAGGSTISLTPADGTYNFGDEGFFKSLFSSALSGYELTDVVFDPIGHTIKFVLVKDPNILTLSDAPSATAWAANTTWFTIRNNRNAKGYLSTQDSGQYLDAQSNLTVKNGTDASGDRGGLWAFVQNGDGINIYNNAYGPDFILGVTGSNGNARLQMYPKDDIPAGVTTLFAYGENSQKDGASHAYYFQVGTSGNNHLNEQSGYPALWNHANKISDAGSAFKVTMVSNDEVNALPEYDVYKTACKGATESFDISYINTSNSFGKRDKANDGSYLILAHGSATSSDQFSLSTTDYSIISTSVDADSNHAYSILNITLRDVFATEEWTVVTSDGSSVNFAGVEYNNGESFFVRPGMTPKHIDFSINAPSDKFVWGPTFDKANKIVNYDVRERATTLESGWYQLQLVTESVVNEINTQINPKYGNLNTPSNTMYTMPALYNVGNATMKFSGVPTYADEVSTFVYIEKQNISGNWLTIQVPNGKYVEAAYGFSLEREPQTEPHNIEYQLNGGILKLRGWKYQTSMAHPLEGPLQVYVSAPNFNDALSFHIYPADLSRYDIYKINFIGDGADDVKNVTLDNVYASGITTVSNGGYIFLAKGSIPPSRTHFSTESSKISGISVGETVNGITNIDLTFQVETETWTIKINGGYTVSYTGIPDANFENNTTINIKKGVVPSAVDFKTNCTDKFVWGPIIDRDTKTVTFDIRELPTSLETGWYQMMLIEDPNNTNAQHRPTAANVNQRIANVSGNINTQSNYIYITPLYNLANNWLGKMTGIPTYGDEPVTYFYIERDGNKLSIQSPNGLYTNAGHRLDGTSASKQTFTNYTFENGILKVGGWTAPGHWTSTNCSGIEGPNVATGNNSEYYQSQYLTKVDVAAKYDVYQINLQGTNQSKVRFIGSGNNSANEVYNNGYFFLTRGAAAPDEDDFYFDGITKIESIAITDNSGKKVITFTVSSRTDGYSNTIIHRQHDVYDRIAVGDDNLLPKGSHIERGEGMIEHPMIAGFNSNNTDNDRQIQNTSVFHVTQYTKPGTSTECILPFTKNKGTGDHVKQYQRWYNYQTEQSLDNSILVLSNFYQFTNGHSNYNSSGTRLRDVLGSANITLPTGSDELYVGVDASEFSDLRAVNGNLVEPSLNMRVVYHIISAHEMAKELTTSGDKWWEAKEYYVPNIKRGSDTYKNNADLIPLDMPFSNYWIYKTSGNMDDSNLMPIVPESGNGSNYNTLRSNLEIVVEGTATDNRPMTDYLEVGVLDENPGNIGGAPYINGNHFLYYKVKGAGETRTIPAGSQAVIKVYAKDGSNGSSPKYQLFKFTLNFQGATEPLAITSVVGNPASTRSVDYFIQNGFKESASLTFQNKEVKFTRINGHRNDGNEGVTYAFPIDFSRTSYGYSPNNTYGNYRITTKGYGIQYRPVSLYEHNIKNRANTTMKCDDDYFFYIDAAESPGQVASISLDGTLCVGSRLYCYGWVGSSNLYNEGAAGASVLLQVVGHRHDGTEEVIASYLPGTLTDVSYDDEGDAMRSLSYASFPSQQQAGWMDINAIQVGVWNSVGFSFVVKDVSFESYDLRIINNCFSTAGGDYVLDDFRVFVSPPKGNVDFTTPLCSDALRHVKVHTDFDMLLEASGINTQVPGAEIPVSFCFLNKKIYDEATKDYYDIAENGNRTLKSGINYDDASVKSIFNNAFGEALIGERSINKNVKGHAFHNFTVPVDFDDIPTYAYNESPDDQIFKEEKANGERRIVFKEQLYQSNGTTHNWEPGESYYLLFSPFHVENEHVSSHDVGTSTFDIASLCCVLTTFDIMPPIEVKGDATVTSSDEVKACDNQIVTFKVDMPALKLDEEGTGVSDVVISGLNYDWWVGTSKVNATHAGFLTAKYGTYASVENARRYNHQAVDDYPDENDVKKDVYLKSALENIRFYFPEARTLEDVSLIDYDNDNGYGIVQEHIDCVRHFITPLSDGRKPLSLFGQTFNLKVSHAEADAEHKQHFVAIPIVPEQVYGVDEKLIYCPSPQELTIAVGPTAPNIQTGFAQMSYPDRIINVPVRIGLQQANNIRKAELADAGNILRVPLRNVVVTGSGSTELVFKNHTELTYGKIYLSATDDPSYSFPTDGDGIDMFCVAQIVEIHASKDGGDDSYMNISFLKGFTLREGYTYSLKVPYEEDMACECDGTLVFDLKVVPEYQIWTGAAGNTDWTNDRNWARADRDVLHAGNEATGAPLTNATDLVGNGYPDNATNMTSASFVPMYFTNVLFANAEVKAPVLQKLTPASLDGRTFIGGLTTTATSDLEYDLEVTPAEASNRTAFNYNVNYVCELFGSNIANGITFTPGGMLYNAHLLNYKKAWVEYEINAGEWYTLASPLQGMVAGEWYTPTAGAKQMTPHFYGITYDENLNDRFRPAFYQRSWNKATANVYHILDDGNYSGVQPENVAIQGNWSNVYNDVDVKYGTGEGFSVKVDYSHMNPSDRPADGKALVRLPKDDASYFYYDIEGEKHNNDLKGENVDRSKSGRLMSDLLNEAGHVINQTITNVDATNNIFLVSNPFMAPLDIDKFFAVNTQFEQKYWLVNANNQMMSVKDEAGWVDVSGGNAGSIAPLQSFFVRSTTETASAAIRFNEDMQYHEALPGATRAIVRLTAKNQNAESSAAVLYGKNVNAQYAADEDCQTFIDNLDPKAPIVYTTTSGLALSINQTSFDSVIPVGMLNITEDMELTIDGENLPDDICLFDAVDNEYYPIGDDILTVTIGKDNSRGRYFITRSDAHIEELPTESSDFDVICTKNGNMLSFVSNVEIAQVNICDLSGRTIYSRKNNSSICNVSTDKLQGTSSVILAKIATAKGTKSIKIAYNDNP